MRRTAAARVGAGGVALALATTMGVTALSVSSAQAAVTGSATGFATQDGGTTGGAGGQTVRATTGTEIHAALCNRASSDTPIIIEVEGTIDHGNTSKVSGDSCNTADDKIEIKEVSNVSIVGVGSGALFDELGIHLRSAENVILQNLHVRNVKKSGSPTSNGGDAIGMESDVSNVWADHLTLEASGGESDGYDALFDMKADTTYVTLSYSILRNSGRGGLVGSSDGDTGNGPVTYHHNLYQNIDSRTPLLRAGTAHSYNNHFVGLTKSGINSRLGAQALVENNYFQDSKDPLGTFYTNDMGTWEVSGNIWDNITWTADDDDNHPAGPNPTSTGSVSVPYSYDLDGAECVPNLLAETAGANTGLRVSDGSCEPTEPEPTPEPTEDPDPEPTEEPTPDPEPTEDPDPTDPPSGENLSIGAGSDGSSKGDGTSYGNVRDGDMATYWSPSGSTGRISIKWDGGRTVSSIVIREAAGAEGNIGSWQVQNHDTGQVLATGSGAGAIDVPTTSLSKINFEITSSSGTPRVAEFETYAGSPSDPEPTEDPTPDPTDEPTPEPTDEPQPGADTLYVAPGGSAGAAGTESDPTTLVAAIDRVNAGGEIFLAGGTYDLDDTVTIEPGNDGLAGDRTLLSALPGQTPVLDFSAQEEDSSNRGLAIGGDYWHVYGIVVQHAGDNGILLGGDHNVIERVVTRYNHDTGLQLSRLIAGAPRDQWPSYNLVVSSESHDNADSDGEDADGFAAKLTSGPGNVFRDTVAHHNIDDGWDLYTKSETGPVGEVTIESSLAFENGTLSDGSQAGAGDRNGFKLGGEDIEVDHVVRDSYAVDNGKHGFTYNSNPGSMTVTNNVSIGNEERNFNFDEGSHTFSGNVSCDSGSSDRYSGTDAGGNSFWDGSDGSACSAYDGAMDWSFAVDGSLQVTFGGSTPDPEPTEEPTPDPEPTEDPDPTDPPSGDNLSIGAGSDGSSKASGTSYGDVRDGDLSTYWSPEGSTGRISIKWDGDRTVSTIVIREASGTAGTIGSYQVVDHDTGDVLTSGTGAGAISFAATSTSKIDFVITSSSGTPRVAEFETYAG
ncbi:right-handed parallel beta-helix repeat-containing protein [Isoptericola chiayiensis]|uniref:Right-handed parallel beta-helix repeat-containing protein n=1 Tax=Isoptericola chiayiensis TaxID=579446 RepID=A0ABP8YJU7_9MICO|nr:right-handed parallel beta-helix repeat-containing protein [Isoptericola chiayiensis]NOW00402.1 pectate lyase [Isoptericola chiayiensis]